jgi:hypothetical protein
VRLPALQGSDVGAWARALVRALEPLLEPNRGGSVTLTASSTTTTVSDGRAAKGRRVLLTPTSATAATAATSVYVSAVAAGTFTLTHNSDAATDRTFTYQIV